MEGLRSSSRAGSCLGTILPRGAAAVALGIVALMVGGGGSALADPGSTCSGTSISPGTISPGTYHALTVTGSCVISTTGPVTVRGGLTITGSGSLTADQCGLTMTVSGGVNGALRLACQPRTS
jgi:hypothetical protein